MKLSFLSPFCGLIIGIFLADNTRHPLSIASFLIGVALCVWIIYFLRSKNPLKNIKLSKLHLIWPCFIFMGIGVLDFQFFCKPEIEKEIHNNNISIKGVIEDIQYAANGEKLKVKINEITDILGNKIDNRRLYILVKTDGYLSSKGDIIFFNAKPLSLNNLKWSNQYSDYLRHQGIQYYANVKSINIEKIGEKNSSFTKLNHIKENLIILIEKSSLSRNTSEFIISLLLGDKSYLRSDTRENLTSVGMAHILALSGLHIGIILSFLLILLYPLCFIGLNKWRRILAILFVWVFVFLTGGNPSTVRAAIMATMVICALLLERKNSALNSLLAAGLIILLINPLDLWDIGFQLSFICVASILIFSSALNPVDHHLHHHLHATVNLFLTTLIASLATWCLVSYYFTSVPLFFLPANLLLLPLLPFFTGLSIIFIILLCFGADVAILSKALDFFYKFFMEGIGMLTLSGDSTLNIKAPLIVVILWLTGILFISIILNRRFQNLKKIILPVGSLFLIAAISIVAFQKNNSTTTLRFVNNYKKIEAQIIQSQTRHKCTFPKENISELKYGNFKITAIDQIIHKDSLNILREKDRDNVNFIIVGSKSNISQIAEIVSTIPDKRVILHSSVSKKKKDELLSLLQEKDWDNIYYLRDDGTLEFEI